MNWNTQMQLVSAVIPTRNRPELACRAVRSALSQTYQNIEVIVVVDGPDETTVSALEALNNERVRIVALAENVGGSEARNIGVRESRGEWIAFLDDDDEWLPMKIETQLRFVSKTRNQRTFIGCRYFAVDQSGQRTLPPLGISIHVPISEFLFCRRKFLGGTGYLQTSTWLVSADLARKVPFTPGLKRNQDVDWLLRAIEGARASFYLVEEPLSIFHSEVDSGRVSRKIDWKFQYSWAVSRRHLFTTPAFAQFLATNCAEDASRQSDRLSALWRIMRTIVGERALSVKVFSLLIYYLCVPNSCKPWLRRVIAMVRRDFTRRDSNADCNC